VPRPDELKLNPDAAYVPFHLERDHRGRRFFTEPETGGVPLICDASSDFLARPIRSRSTGCCYAGAQKNVGPSGLAIVIVREDLLARVRKICPRSSNYKLLAENDLPVQYGHRRSACTWFKLVTGWVC